MTALKTGMSTWLRFCWMWLRLLIFSVESNWTQCLSYLAFHVFSAWTRARSKWGARARVWWSLWVGYESKQLFGLWASFDRRRRWGWCHISCISTRAVPALPCVACWVRCQFRIFPKLSNAFREDFIIQWKMLICINNIRGGTALKDLDMLLIVRWYKN